ncbi:MAG: VgrG-related protein [Acidimicrobiales bacterium]
MSGSPLSTALYDDLIDARVEQSVHVPDRFSLRFRDPTFEVIDANTFTIGDSVDISVSDGQTENVVTRGEITAIASEQGASGRHELIVSGLDRGHRLARGPMSRTFLNVTDSDVARTIAGEKGLQADVEASTVRHEYLLQSGTDYAFLTDRARAIGYDWWVTNNKLYFRKDSKLGAGPTLEFGADLMRFKVRASCAEAAGKVEVRGWNPDTQQAILGSADMSSANADALGTDAALATAAVKGAATFGRAITRGTGMVGVSSVAEADALAKSMANSATAEYVSARGEARGNPLLRAGVEIEIKGVGQKLSGHYLLTSVEHVLGAGRAYVTRFVSGGRSPDTLVDLLSRPSASVAWGHLGLVIGIVTNNKDPDGLGRIKVRFPTLSDDEESWWARVAAIGAGATRGLSVLFEVNDEVLLGFEHGDVRRPIVLGGLWSKKNKPHIGGEETDASGVASRVWRSRTGHVVAMHDANSPAQSFIAITLADGKTSLRMGEDKVTLDSPTDITITSQTNVSVVATGDLALEGANITVKAKNGLTMEAVNLAAKGKASVKLEGAQAELKGSATVNVEGGALAAVKGAIVKLN